MSPNITLSRTSSWCNPVRNHTHDRCSLMHKMSFTVVYNPRKKSYMYWNRLAPAICQVNIWNRDTANAKYTIKRPWKMSREQLWCEDRQMISPHGGFCKLSAKQPGIPGNLLQLQPRVPTVDLGESAFIPQYTAVTLQKMCWQFLGTVIYANCLQVGLMVGSTD